MPKRKKANINDKKQCTKKKTGSKRQRKSVFKFDIKKNLKERWEEGNKLLKQSAESDEEMIVNNDLYQENFNDNSNADSTELCTQRFKIMSIEQNESVAKIHYNHLMKASWSPEFDNVHYIWYKWRPDLDTPTSGLTLEVDNDNAIIAVAQDIHLKYNKDDLLNMRVDLFLPLKGHTMKKNKYLFNIQTIQVTFKKDG
ncbi:Uncharacterized protein FWK35_00008600 [Aphis craccivora]|uniref:Uncharacterized protein n=1 Tax=Aphis craccivora TaxID=307492 RepID=A0A6G0YW10_APHCR|nr:Uncharacterized protein FWK35_00008600 [Aphis craccivora]